MANICPDCGGNCTEILLALRQALGLPPICLLCGATAINVQLYAGEPYCFHCAKECFD